MNVRIENSQIKSRSPHNLVWRARAQRMPLVYRAVCEKVRIADAGAICDTDCGATVVDDIVMDAQEVQIASLTRAMYHSGAALGSQSVRLSRGGPGASGGAGMTRPATLSSVLVLLVTLGTATVAAVRARVKAVRECKVCQGYGVQRCKLCSGRGTIDWEGKMAHREPCPMCLGRRLHKCSACGGGILMSRSLFNHKANKGEAALMETLQTLTSAGNQGPGARGLLGFRIWRGKEDQDERLVASDEYASEVITD
jgi:hypothetical protein